jgi:hypothetical protein
MKAGKSAALDALLEVAEGDLWGNIPFSWESSAPASNLTKVTMSFREHPNDIDPVLVLTSVASANITIAGDGSTWTFTLNSQILNLTPGTYHWYIRCWDSAPSPIHWMEGKMLVRLNGSRASS